MKILLIAPASGNWRHIGRRRFFNGRTFRFSMLSLLSVAAESPPEAEMRIVDEQIDEIPWDADVDLVGITCMTAAAPRAYEIARRFRRRRIPVVLGGMQLLHRHGITVEAGIVFGFDGDGPEVFRRTLETLDTLEVDLIQVSIFTPLPGTPRAKLLADRVFDRDWANYDFHHAVFQPAGMSARELQAGHDWVTRQFYRPWRIVRRLWRHLRRPGGWASLVYLAAVNAAYLGRAVCWGIRGWNPAGETSVEHDLPGRNRDQRRWRERTPASVAGV